MKAFPQPRTGTAILAASVLMIAGLVPVLYFVALVAWQVSAVFQAGAWVPLPASLLFTKHSLAFIPELPWAANETVTAILGRVHVGLVPALAGFAIMALAVLRLGRQMAAIRTQTQWNEDRLRRVQNYRDEGPSDALDGRREPFIGSMPRPAGESEGS